MKGDFFPLSLTLSHFLFSSSSSTLTPFHGFTRSFFTPSHPPSRDHTIPYCLLPSLTFLIPPSLSLSSSLSHSPLPSITLQWPPSRHYIFHHISSSSCTLLVPSSLSQPSLFVTLCHSLSLYQPLLQSPSFLPLLLQLLPSSSSPSQPLFHSPSLSLTLLSLIHCI